MPSIHHVAARRGDVLLLAGTMKGLFVLRSDAKRKRWEVGGPYSIGAPVYAAAFDSRNGRQRLWWSQQSFRWGTVLQSSDDFGKTITEPTTYSVKFPENSGLALKNIWQICVNPAGQPDTIYCGVEPAALFVSRDAGASWSLVEGLFNHPPRPKWVPGAGGICLHTILPGPVDPKRMMIAISTAGTYRTLDGGGYGYNHALRVDRPGKNGKIGRAHV